MELQVRCLEMNDLEAVLSIQSDCPGISQWKREDYARVARAELAGCTGWISEQHRELIGFLVVRRVVTDVEILNFAVYPRLRRAGVGTALLLHAVKWADSFKADNIFLEVRESNLPARRFYEKHSFQITGRRRTYYSSPVEDALLLTASLHRGGA